MLLALIGCTQAKPDTTIPVDTTDTTDTVVALVEPVAIALAEVGDGFGQVTDIAFPPGRSDVAIVLDKTGTARWFAPADGSKGPFFQISVPTQSELGLLGIAFHPDFATNGKFYLNYNTNSGGLETKIAEWAVPPGADLTTATPTETRTILTFRQPYANHNGGCLKFGPDGLLYIGTGDGGDAGDPHDNGQNLDALLGKMLRIDVNSADAGLAYHIPADNPFVGQAGRRPEIWAYGLRNPWRYSFAPDGRLIVADVGQNQYDEVDIVSAGGNYGWNVREGFHCYGGGTCDTTGLIDPIFEYGRAQGVSITGGYVYTGSSIPEQRGWYIFADYGSSRFWALELPDGPVTADAMARAVEIGQFTSVGPTTFARDAAGELYVGDINGGKVLKITRGP